MDTRLRTLSRAAALLALAASLGGCAETTPRWDSSFGTTVRSTFAAQVINPAAARNPNPAGGIDGQAAMAAQKKYESGQASQEPPAAPASMMIGSASK